MPWWPCRRGAGRISEPGLCRLGRAQFGAPALLGWTALPNYPALHSSLAAATAAPLSHGAQNARTARRTLAAVLAGEAPPEPWMEEVTVPDEHEDEQRTCTKLITAIGDYRRHHRGPRTPPPVTALVTLRLTG